MEDALTRLREDLQERLDALDTFLEGLALEQDLAPQERRRPAQIQVELQNILRIPLRLPREVLEQLHEEPQAAREHIQRLLEEVVRQVATRSVTLQLQRIVGPDFQPEWDWDQPPAALQNTLIQQINRYLSQERTRLLKGLQDDLRLWLQDDRLQREPEPAPAEVKHALLPHGDAEAASPTVQRLLDSRVQALLQILQRMEWQRKQVIDPKTHQPREVLVPRLRLYYAVAQDLDPADPATADAILEHLDRARRVLEWSVGWEEVHRLSTTSMRQLTEKAQAGLRRALGDERFEQYRDVPLGNLPEEVKAQVARELGRQVQTENYRLLLLHIFNSEWAEYLTEMEALRTSVGLEAFAQRDPLVQYKRKAFELYERLLRRIRARAIERMFQYRTQESRVQTRGEARIAQLGPLSIPGGLTTRGGGVAVPTPSSGAKAKEPKKKKRPKKPKRQPATVAAEGGLSKSQKRKRRKKKRK
ncbi:MAG: hypothetical protein GXO36_05305 [Chloroflexi bacterium]|nr:hypothetical protein [Chloroflexota bacterium]